jgi:P-type Cu+ transporter
MALPLASAQRKCDHCGEFCRTPDIISGNKIFCCTGCQSVFDLINESNLCHYYKIDSKAGNKPINQEAQERFQFLNNTETSDKLLIYKDSELASVVLTIPGIHCSSCIWLLEHLYKFDKGILNSRIDFLAKQLTIQFRHKQVSLKRIVEILASLGYTPQLSLENLDKKVRDKVDRTRIYRIAIAGFCFANIMILSFPEYFHINEQGDSSIQQVFTKLVLILSLPVFFYSASEFFISSLKGLRAGFVNIDLPLSLSILLTFARSVYDISSGTGAGYMDSMSGIVFLMLIGRYFQDKTQKGLQFDRDYKSFFPIAVSLKKLNGETTSISLNEIKVGDKLLIHSGEIIPTDSILVRGDAVIDYSFVTGESRGTLVRNGEKIFAGGKQISGLIECEVTQLVPQSYLTNLWNREGSKKQHSSRGSKADLIAKYFSIVLILISIGGFSYWYPSNPTKAFNVLTTVLIVACPCALLLSATFTNGSVLRIFSRNKFYIKNAEVIERLSKLNHIVFDKTGTLTDQADTVEFVGADLTEQEKSMIYSLVIQSNHPLSQSISAALNNAEPLKVSNFKESVGQGISGAINNLSIKLGSREFAASDFPVNKQHTLVYASIDSKPLGYFKLSRKFRNGLQSAVRSIEACYDLSVISGDNENDKESLTKIFGSSASYNFNQSPENKVDYIENLRNTGKNVAMVGDGLNDAGALLSSDVGIAISDNINNFSPSSDGILEGSALTKLNALLKLSQSAQKIIYFSFTLSLLYNIVGISYAVQGLLSPLIAAILMPVSSISIILFTTGLSRLAAKNTGLAV